MFNSVLLFFVIQRRHYTFIFLTVVIYASLVYETHTHNFSINFCTYYIQYRSFYPSRQRPQITTYQLQCRSFYLGIDVYIYIHTSTININYTQLKYIGTFRTTFRFVVVNYNYHLLIEMNSINKYLLMYIHFSL